jgi:hypothetical protein
MNELKRGTNMAIIDRDRLNMIRRGALVIGSILAVAGPAVAMPAAAAAKAPAPIPSPSSVDLSGSALSGPSTGRSDGVTPYRLTVTLRDATGAPVAVGTLVQLRVVKGRGFVVGPAVATDSLGQAVVSTTTTRNQYAVLGADDVTDSITLNTTLVVQFVP